VATTWWPSREIVEGKEVLEAVHARSSTVGHVVFEELLIATAQEDAAPTSTDNPAHTARVRKPLLARMITAAGGKRAQVGETDTGAGEAALSSMFG
jgi:hypothetical protein